MYKRCSSGRCCEYAHGKDELEEWKRRKRLYQNKLKLRNDTGDRSRLPLRQKVAEELRATRDESGCFQHLVCFYYFTNQFFSILFLHLYQIALDFPSVDIFCDPCEIVYITSTDGKNYKQLFCLRLDYSSDAVRSVAQ